MRSTTNPASDDKKLSVTIKVEAVEEKSEDSTVTGLDVTCGDTTFIPVEIDDEQQ